MRFTKMQGIGNDYLYVNCFEEQPKGDISLLAKRMSDRHFGVGSDGLVLIEPSNVADFRMRMYNSDGSEGKMCGNASRCIGKYVFERGLTTKQTITLETASGIRSLNLHVEDGTVESVCVDMGEPILEPSNVPVLLEGESIVDYPIQVQGMDYHITCLSMGNPHCVIFGNDPASINLPLLGPMFEKNAIFPQATNTEFVQVIDRTHVKMRVWERGAGETLACGTGACAVAVASALLSYTDRSVTVSLLGGELHIVWDEKSKHVFMSGPAAFIFDGEWNEE